MPLMPLLQHGVSQPLTCSHLSLADTQSMGMPGPVGTFRGAYQMVTRPQTAESLPQTPGTPSPQISNTSRKFDAVIKPCRLLADPS